MKFLCSLNKTERLILGLSVICAAFLSLPGQASAMHIMEGYLPIGYSIAWGAVCIPFLVLGIFKLRKTIEENKRALILLAMSGAFIFVISSLKIPTVTGSCSYMTGAGLSAILFGVTTTSVLGIIVLIFQAVLLAHGGLTTLGANTFSMAIAGPAVAVLLFSIGKKLKLNRSVSVFIAAAAGDLFTYCVTSIQLALAHPSQSGGVTASLAKFLVVFAPTQVPLAIVEGLLTVLIVIGLEKYAKQELTSIAFLEAK